MRKFAVAVVVVVLVIMTSEMWSGIGKRQPDYCRVLKEQIESKPMKVYENKMYGFKTRYPAIFTQVDVSESDGGECARFVFNDIILENRVVIIPSGQPFDKSVDSIARSSCADSIRRGDGWFVISGPLYDDNGLQLDGFRYYSKYVCRQRLLFVYTAFYPVVAEPALQRVFDTIGEWDAGVQ